VKKLLSIVMAITAIMAMAAPAMAASPTPVTATTGASIVGSGIAPVIIAKWETTGTDPNSENGDTPHTNPGTQVLPSISLFSQGDTTPDCEATVYYWVLVKGEPDAHDNIGEVAVNVLEPKDFVGANMGVPPINTANGVPDDPTNDYAFKYKVVLDLFKDSWMASDPVKTEMVNAITCANDAGLLTIATSYTLNDIIGTEAVGQALIKQGKVRLYRGHAEIEHPQAGGIYWVQAFAYDAAQNAMSAILLNCFDYVRVVALDKDFTNINWGNVVKNHTAVVCGDNILGGALPTMKTGGNCALDVSVLYSNMYADIGGVQTPMQEVSFDAYLFDESNRIFEPGPADFTRESLNISYPFGPTGTHLWLPICTPEKVGFSIYVQQAQPGNYTGSVTFTATDNGIPWIGKLCANEPACPNA